MKTWLKRMKRVLDRSMELFFAVVLFPFVFPYYARPGWTRLIGLFSLPLSFFVWSSIYVHVLRIVFLLIGFRPEDGDILGTLSADLRDHFGIGFFVCFFPLMAYYLYVVRTDRLDMEKVRAYFAERTGVENGAS